MAPPEGSREPALRAGWEIVRNNPHNTHTIPTQYQRYSHATHTLLIRYSYATHTLLIRYSHATHTLLTRYSLSIAYSLEPSMYTKSVLPLRVIHTQRTILFLFHYLIIPHCYFTQTYQYTT